MLIRQLKSVLLIVVVFSLNSCTPVQEISRSSRETALLATPTRALVSPVQETDGWEQRLNAAQYGGANWNNWIETRSGMTVESAKSYADSRADITFFFYVDRPFALAGNANRNFSRGDAVFFKGSPWVGSAPARMYVKQATTECQTGKYIVNNREVEVKRIVKVNMVALNQSFWYNRLGASQLDGMIFALASDIVLKQGGMSKQNLDLLKDLQAGKKGDYSNLVDYVTLRPDKRPRPIVLRANENDCLDIHFTNLLAPTVSEITNELSIHAGVHIEGTEMFSTVTNNASAIKNDAAFIGRNTNNLAAPGESTDYSLFVPAEGAYELYSAGDDFGNFFEGQLTLGLFGALNVQPETAEYYRSQVTEEDLSNATVGHTAEGQPVINYQAMMGTKPILNMLKQLGSNTFELVYTDPTAIITGPDAGPFRDSKQPVFNPVPQYPDRTQPYREFNIMYHEPVRAEQTFRVFDTNGDFPAAITYAAGGDFFAINYGMAGIGPEIYSNRIGVGPMDDCATCAYEEFFLSSWAVGDPAMVVDVPANFTTDSTPNPIPTGTTIPNPNPPVNPPDPIAGPKATKAFYPDDPSNVYHSYMSDHVKFRIHHGAGTLHHLHHLHAHQWLHSPKSDNGHYLDSQLIGPGSSFTLDMVYNGSGNRNQTVGDSIFHCHFYPHFAEGMWSLWRVHDVFEAGTELDDNGTPIKGARALPDGEITAGTPIPAIVPLPHLAMAPMPSDVFIDDGQIVFGTPASPDPSGSGVRKNPGYPFFIPGIAGERAPHPPMDFAELGGSVLDGGLPRHVVTPFNQGSGYDPEIVEYHNRFDFSKFHNKLEGEVLPENGTPVERIAMRTHSKRLHPSFTPENNPKQFVLNGLPPVKGAPYADPCSMNSASQHLQTPIPISPANTRHYRGADMQMDVILNKKGWHYSQQRFGILWEDIIPTLNKERAPEPLFFRANSEECIEYWMANIVPEYYELDDFQVRTPTDILGQHIHLVKFDVTSSDGGANGWNYEDGTFAPETVVSRLEAFEKGTLKGYTGNFQPVAPTWLCDELTGSNKAECEARAKTEWLGAQATVQRWYADPQLNNMGDDRTLRTVFTHDHFSPSTHQQAGLYMGLLVEPKGSSWKDSETGVAFGTRADGGPTSWQAIITTDNDYKQDSYREFMLEFQDFQLAYTKEGLRPEPCVKDGSGNLPPTCYPHENETTFYGLTETDYLANVEPVLNAISNVTSTNTPCGSSTAVQYVDAVGSCTQNYTGYLSPFTVINPPQGQAGDAIPPTLISTTPPFALGTYSVNYRNEPIPFRVWDPTSNVQTNGVLGDLGHVYTSIKRADPELNTQDPKYPDGSSYNSLTAGAYPADPYTPLMRAFQGDKVQVRTLVGAHINMHNFSMQGFRWLFEPANNRSGYRSNQPMGISEHFEMLFDINPSTVSGMSLADAGDPTQRAGCDFQKQERVTFADYLYNPSSEENGLFNGNWGLLRAYQPAQGLCLEPLPNNPPKKVEPVRACPANAPSREYNVVAITADQLPDKTVIYSSKDREDISDDNGLLYFGCDATANPSCSVNNLISNLPKQTPDKHLEPFILRAAAGECITVNLTNKFNVASGSSFPGAIAINNEQEQNAMLQFRYLSDTNVDGNCASAPGGKWLCDMKVAPSKEVALAPQLVSYDINTSNGVNLGFNNLQTAAVGNTKRYRWYAGITSVDTSGRVSYTPAEFGTANLLTADQVGQIRYGMLAGMVIEPEGSCWSSQDGSKSTCSNALTAGVIPGSNSDSLTGASVTVHLNGGKGKDYFQEFVVMAGDSLAASRFTNNMNYGVERMSGKDTGLPARPVATQPPNQTDGNGRYRDTVAWPPNTGHPERYILDLACGFSNALGSPYPATPPGNNYPEPTGIALGEPETPIFRANPGEAVRFRVMQQGGADQHTFELFGHVWQEEPYNAGSTVITNNPDSQWQGSRMGLSAADRFDIVLASAGGSFATPGDYLYRSFPGGDQNYGMWGIFRVGNPRTAYPCSNGTTTRPLVCVPQWNGSTATNRIQYVYSHKSFASQGYQLPSGCSLTGSSSEVQCTCQ